MKKEIPLSEAMRMRLLFSRQELDVEVTEITMEEWQVAHQEHEHWWERQQDLDIVLPFD
jgi:hypothetical protein